MHIVTDITNRINSSSSDTLVCVRKLYQVVFINDNNTEVNIYTCIIFGASAASENKQKLSGLKVAFGIYDDHSRQNIDKNWVIKNGNKDISFLEKARQKLEPWKLMWGEKSRIGDIPPHKDMEDLCRDEYHVDDDFIRSFENKKGIILCDGVNPRNTVACIPGINSVQNDGESLISYNISSPLSAGDTEIISWTHVCARRNIAESTQHTASFEWKFERGGEINNENRRKFWKFDDVKLYIVLPYNREVDINSSHWIDENREHKNNVVARQTKNNDVYFDQWESHHEISESNVYKVISKNITEISVNRVAKFEIILSIAKKKIQHFELIISLIMSSCLAFGLDQTRLTNARELLKKTYENCSKTIWPRADWICAGSPMAKYLNVTSQWVFLVFLLGTCLVFESLGRNKNFETKKSGIIVRIFRSKAWYLAALVSGLYWFTFALLLSDNDEIIKIADNGEGLIFIQPAWVLCICMLAMKIIHIIFDGRKYYIFGLRTPLRTLLRRLRSWFRSWFPEKTTT